MRTFVTKIMFCRSKVEFKCNQVQADSVYRYNLINFLFSARRLVGTNHNFKCISCAGVYNIYLRSLRRLNFGRGRVREAGRDWVEENKLAYTLLMMIINQK